MTPRRRTSLSIRKASRLKVKAAVIILNARGYEFSEQSLYRECLALALQFWKGRGGIAQRNTRYNHRKGEYEIVPFYTTEHLRRTVHARGHHAGISISRMVDFGIEVYLERIIERVLSRMHRGEFMHEVAMWKARYEKRHNRAAIIINYSHWTAKPQDSSLKFGEEVPITPWPKDKLVIFMES